MNLIDFTQPNGFPLEADATLGFMQTDYQNAITGLAKYFGEGVIVSGMTEAGSTVADGWIVLNGQLIFFQGGTKTTYFIIEETWVQKANEDGSLLNRYKTVKAKFGTGGTQYAYADLVRLESINNLQNRLIDALTFEGQVIISGCAVSSVDTGASTLAIAAGKAIINRKFINAPAYTGGYPVYLNESGAWVNTAPVSNYITFNPYTSQRLADVYARATSKTGEIRMMAILPTAVDGSGLGKWDLLGWALCNGANGTVDLRSRFLVGYDPRNTDPGGNLWDVNYNTPGNAGGEKAHTLTTAEMPAHTHTGGTGTVAAGAYGLVRRSVASENVTVSSPDTSGSGTEPDLTLAPQHIPSEGGGTAHENRPPYRVVVYLQRI